MSEKKKIDINQVVSYLNHAFSNAIAQSNIEKDNTKGTVLHQLQVDFCYLIDEIQRGPLYIVPKKIAEANELIDSIINGEISETS